MFNTNYKNQSKLEFEWVTKIVNGDASAFEKLFNVYCQLLINFSFRFVYDIGVAENIVQDVFVKVWKKRKQLNPNANIKYYLYTAVKNESLKYQRHNDVKQQYVKSIDQNEQLANLHEEDSNSKEIGLSINDAISQLPEKARIIFQMNRFDQLTYKEIAKIQNISIKTVETHMSRALKFLRKQLSHLISYIF